ncbi:MAG: B12-binding domain-containing radical SAM protein [Proteobacteria bacterium]|nr:B12-binding domain-containing radical SAM protein [Pseudomonadota bacterium]
MDILLIEPDHKCGIEYFPWGILAVGSYLRQQNFDVGLINASYLLERDFRAQLFEALPKTRAVGISCFSTDAAFVRDLCAEIKGIRPELQIIVGGPHAVLRPEQTAAHPDIDFVIHGPGEEPTEQLLTMLGQGNTDFEKVPGICFRRDGRLIRTPPVGPVPEYRVDYSLLPANKLATLAEYMEVLSGRGCSFQCTFCYNAVCGQKWLGKTADALLDEIDVVLKRYNPHAINFRDENFFQSKERILAFLAGYHERGYTFRWDATCRASYFTKSYIDEALLQRIAQANCRRLKFGFESGSQRVLNFLKKGNKVESYLQVAKLVEGTPIIGSYSFLVGVPTETAEECRQTLALVRDILDVDPNCEILGPQYYRVYPGGELYNYILAGGYGYSEPDSFEGWAKVARGDYFGLAKGATHPWIKGFKTLARHADMLVFLARTPINRLLVPRKLLGIPFALLAKLRLRFRLYALPWDLKLAGALYSRYASMMLPKSKRSV